jgi:hypothetical protein
MRLSEIIRPDDDLKTRIRKLVDSELNRAEKIWERSREKMLAKAILALESRMDSLSVPTNIPGHPTIDPSEPPVDWFIAFVLDMRDSTNHMLQAISEKDADVSELERIFYETSALLPAAAEVVRSYDGKVTEYLGDGLLALFRATEDKEQRDKACYQSRRAAQFAVGDMRTIVNDALKARYRLPPLDMGVGMAFSQALVTLVGHPAEPAPKAFGHCVYRATKLADQVNKVHVDERLEEAWPTSTTGTFRFTPHHNKHGFKSFIMP